MAGGNTVTGKHRAKRIDVRPSVKKRKQAAKLKNIQKEAGDLRVVRKKKSERKEREVDPGGTQLKRLNNKEKKIRALTKTLRQIEQLEEKQKAGEALDAAQSEKLGRKEDIVGHLLELEGLVEK
ncbi:unnamed protein product [Heterosigma akashiwo]|mmetsp:Transcript_6361/g.9403  ORF Transcript_6361/g.9403 Transcript_6361/m.9403 type:complete len:124 (-) Transcript_6361:160-531(-)